VIVFGVDDDAKTYLERQVGLKEANRLMSSEVNVWHWNVRFFKPQQEEEFQVGVSPEGNITGYEHKIPEAKAGAQPTRDAAQKTAQNFLIAKLGKPATDWDFLTEEANSERKPKPARLGVHLGKAWIPGKGRAGTFADSAARRGNWRRRRGSEGSEQWQRDYAHLRSTNIFLQSNRCNSLFTGFRRLAVDWYSTYA